MLNWPRVVDPSYAGPLGFGRRLRLLGFFLALLIGLAGMFHKSAGQAVDTGSGGPVILLKMKSAIGFVTQEMLNRAIERAEKERASALVIELDTPGGLLSSTREMIQAILASRVPIVVYVSPSGARAASAGTFLIYASHVAVMTPGTHLGAATPIRLGVPGMPGSPPATPKSDKDGKDGKDQTPKTPSNAGDRKSLNDALAYIRSLAELRGRNAQWGEKAVREASTLTASEALKENVIDLVVPTLGELLAKIDGRKVVTASGSVVLSTNGKTLIEVSPDWKMKILSTIADPNIAFVLFLVGIYGIIFEFMNPGTIGPGVIGAICLLLAMTALSVLPVSYGGLALVILGVLLLIGEALAPGIGILGIGGVIALAMGAFFLFDPNASDVPFGVAWPVILGAVFASAAIMLGVLGAVFRTRQQAVRTGSEEMIGSACIVESWEANSGRVRCHGESWTARAERELSPGDEVNVVRREGLTLIVG